MTTLSHIQQKLADLDQRQLLQVAEFIEKIKLVNPSSKKITDFYGAFTARQRSASKVEMRQQVSDYLAQKHKLGQE
ncbi:hypothetical protein [Leptolyngbya sp. PCC 6406]|uniref:hypothetical protein n=1 Tax=Leptolyngbya sp. PCC 6406 TaxID=1173264 RepID=UPI0002ABAEB3|nr:hypothetical protein [Leptolyngbya sp. PCC 6406]